VSDDLRLERALRELGAELAIPPAPALVPAVSRRLRDEQRPRPRPFWRRPAVLALAVLAAVVAATLAVEPARTALFDLFRIGGVSVERVDELPEVDPHAPLGLGRRVTMAEARRAVRYRVLALPEGEPDAVYLSRGIAGGAVSQLYGDDDEVRLLLTQFRGSIEPDFVKKMSAGSEFTVADVRGQQAYWLSGAPHAVMFRDERGVMRTDQYRLAGNVLLWVENGVTFRLEGRMTRAEALRLANSLR
jgi:hypothetical protein